MFAVHCPRHGRRVLLGYEDVVAVTNTADGPVVDWRCFCGERGRLSSRPRRSLDR